MDDNTAVRRKQLGDELRQLRLKVGITGEAAAESIGRHQVQISRIETGERRVNAGELDILLDVYGAAKDEEICTRLRGLLDEPGRRERTTHGAATPRFAKRFMDLERGAKGIRTYHTGLWPGLLQTEATARAIVTAFAVDFGLGADEIERRLRVRAERQLLLTRSEPAQFHSVIDEAILRRPIGGPEVTRGQLERVAWLGQLPNVTIQILPFATGQHAALGTTFTLLELPGSAGPALAYLETLTSAAYVEGPSDVERYTVIHDRLHEAALSENESRELLLEMAGQYR